MRLSTHVLYKQCCFLNFTISTIRAGLRGGGKWGQLPREPRWKGAPGDEIYLFQIKYSFENYVIQKRYKNTTLYYIPMLR